MTKIYNGYKSNYEANEYNYRTLKESNIADGYIYLMKYDNNIYRGTISCDEGFEYIDYWVKEYFDLSYDITIKWLSKEMIEQHESGNIENVIVSFEKGFYDDENGARWADPVFDVEKFLK